MQMFEGLMVYTADNPQCDRTSARGQCVCYEGHLACCQTADGFRFWPDVSVEQKTVAFFAAQAGMKFSDSQSDTCPECDQYKFMHHAAQACFPVA